MNKKSNIQYIGCFLMSVIGVKRVESLFNGSFKSYFTTYDKYL